MVVDFWMPNKAWDGCNVNDPSARVLASSHSVDDICRIIGADSLGYMKVEDLPDTVNGLPLCKACFDNHYPMDIPNQNS